MSHELEILENGEASMFSAGGEVPWHGLGTVIEDEAARSAEALELAGLDWEVSKEPSYVVNGFVPGTEDDDEPAINWQEVPNTYHIQRDRDGDVLGTVKGRYVPLQNKEAFAFGDDLLDDSGAHWITAGSLKGGSLVWMMAKLPEAIYIDGLEDEAIQPYIMVSNGHDGSKSVEATVTPIRVVCNNTFTAALSGAKRTFKIRHTKNMSGRINEAKRTLGITHAYMNELQALGTNLVNQKFSDAEFEKFLETLVPTEALQQELDASEKDKSIALTKALNKQEAIREVYKTTDNLQNIRGTKWGALQAVIDFNDHHIPGRGDNKAENRMSRILMPQTANIGHNALALLLA